MSNEIDDRFLRKVHDLTRAIQPIRDCRIVWDQGRWCLSRQPSCVEANDTYALVKELNDAIEPILRRWSNFYLAQLKTLTAGKDG